jgi:hypothetical protein
LRAMPSRVSGLLRLQDRSGKNPYIRGMAKWIKVIHTSW